MSDAITVLLLEHRQFARVLHLLDEQYVHAMGHGPVNYQLLETIFDYLLDYPAECHHPKEDLVYRTLLKRVPALSASLKDLVEEHWKLALLTQNMSQAIADTPRDEATTNQSLAVQLKAFVDYYRQHMRKEEEHFFPLASQALSREDLAEIDFRLFNQPERFGAEDDGKFAALYAAITELGIADRVDTYLRDEAAMIAKFQDVASFNDAMRATGEHVMLGRSGEGYRLECEGNVAAHIPPCDESVAAWCAYFFWKGNAQARSDSGTGISQ